MEDLIEIIINIVLTVVCAAISFFQFRNKGFLFNNSIFTHQSRSGKQWIKNHIIGSQA